MISLSKLLLIVVLYMINEVQCYASSTQPMQNTAVRKNGSVTWYWPSRVLNWAVYHRVGQYFKYLRQSASGDRQQTSMLQIRNVIKDVAGTHSIITAINDREYMAELVVLDSGPTCRSNTTGRKILAPATVQLSCELSFAGNVAPSLRWASASKHLKSDPLVTRWKGNYALGKVTLTATMRVVSSELVTCQAYFERSTPNATCPRLTSILPRPTGSSCERATNVIAQTYNCSTPIVVKLPLGRIFVEPKETTLCVGSKLVLKASDNYTRVNFMWLHPSTHAVLSYTANLTLTARMLGRRHFIGFVYAHDNVLTSKYILVNVTVQECIGRLAAFMVKPAAAGPGVERLAHGEIAAIALAVIVFTTVIVAIIYYLYMIKQNKTVDVKLDELLFETKSGHVRHDGGGEGRIQLPPITELSRRHASTGPELRLPVAKKKLLTEAADKEHVACGPNPRREMSQQTRGKRKVPKVNKTEVPEVEKTIREDPKSSERLSDVIEEPFLKTLVQEVDGETGDTRN